MSGPSKSKTGRKMTILCTLLTIIGLTLMGCNTFIDHLTPAPVSSIVMDYIPDYNVPNYWGFTSLYHVRHLEIMVDICHRTNQLGLLRQVEDDKLDHADAKAYVKAARQEGQAIQDIVIGSEGNPFSVAGLLATAVPGLMVGRAMKRKGDYSPEDVKKLATDVEKRTRAKVLAEFDEVHKEAKIN